VTTFIVKKLVRDRTQERIEKYGGKVHVHTLSPTETIEKLKEKLLEESQEVADAMTPEELLSEIGDVYSVLRGLRKYCNISDEQIEVVLAEKKLIRGEYDNRCFVEKVEVEKDHHWFEYYNSQPKRYPKK